MIKDLGTIKRSIIGCLILLFCGSSVLYGFARAYRKSGTATTTNATVVFSFNPRTFTACNDETAGGSSLYIDPTDGVAATTDDSTNLIIKAAECHTFQLDDPSVLNEFEVGVITSAGTAAYRLQAIR